MGGSNAPWSKAAKSTAGLAPGEESARMPWSAAESISLVYLDAKISTKCRDFAEVPDESRTSLTACGRGADSNSRCHESFELAESWPELALFVAHKIAIT